MSVSYSNQFQFTRILACAAHTFYRAVEAYTDTCSSATANDINLTLVCQKLRLIQNKQNSAHTVKIIA